MPTATPVKPVIADGVVFLPKIPGVTYLVNEAVKAGKFNLVGSIRVKAVPELTYTFPSGSATSWVFVQDYSEPFEDDPFTLDDNDQGIANFVLDSESLTGQAVVSRVGSAVTAAVGPAVTAAVGPAVESAVESQFTPVPFIEITDAPADEAAVAAELTEIRDALVALGLMSAAVEE